MDDVFNGNEIDILKRIPIQSLGEKHKTLDCVIKEHSVVDRKPFKGYELKKTKMFRITFETLDNYNAFKRNVHIVN